MIPKVKFKVATPGHVIPFINSFLNPKEKDWDWSIHILKRYSQLEKQIKDIKNIKKRNEISKEFFENYIKNHKKEFEKKVVDFQEEWDRTNDLFMNALSDILEINWPSKNKIFIAYVSPNPICPRDILKRNFDVYIGQTLYEMKRTAFHEILHFLWFEKWKKIFPKTSEKHFDAPYLEWELSEMVPITILNDKTIQEIFSHKPSVYDEYNKAKIKGKPLLNYIKKFYNRKISIEDFMKKSWNFVNKYKKEIKEIN